MKFQNKSPQNPNIYAEGFRKGVDIALGEKEFHVRKINPYNSIWKPNAKADFDLGARDGVKDGIRLREQKRAREILKITNNKSDLTQER